MKKIILDLCGGTGSWGKPWEEAGYDVKLITWPKYDVTKYSISASEIEFHRIDSPKIYEPMRFPIAAIHGILAAPPCTKFSLADWRTPLQKRDLHDALKVVNACLSIIHEVQSKKKIWWALENPTGHLRKFLGIPPFSFQGWEFGELSETYATKKNDIWGYFKSPAKLVRRRPKEVTATRKSKHGWYAPKKPEWAKDMKLNRADIRAITSPGFAKAFFEANQ